MVPLTAAYVYAAVRAARRLSPGRVPPGVPGATRPRVEPFATALWAVVSDVPLDVYGPAALEPRLQDLEWVAEVAVGHEAVVEHFARMRDTTVIPMKLFTMFSSVEKMQAEMRSGQRAISRAVRHIAGCEEWGVRIARAGGMTISAGEGRTPKARPTRHASGTAFLLDRKAARDAESTARALAADTAGQVYAKLAGIARDATRRDARAPGGTNPPILDAAFLVPVRSRSRFKGEARKLAAMCAAAGTQMTLTGPWPAYSFVGAPA